MHQLLGAHRKCPCIEGRRHKHRLQVPRLRGPRSASSPHLLTPAYTIGGVPPKTAHSFLLAAPSSVAKPERLGRRVTMVTNEVPGISSLRGLGELSNRAGSRAGGGCARRTPRCPRAPTPPLEVVAESLAPGPPAGPLAVLVRHQGLGRPLEAAFLCQETSVPGLGFWSGESSRLTRFPRRWDPPPSSPLTTLYLPIVSIQDKHRSPTVDSAIFEL